MKNIPYATQCINKKDLVAVEKALRSDYLTQGPMVEVFEQKIADFCGAKFAVAVNSGTTALHLACLVSGIKPGDEVITSPITFVASANAVLYCEAKPVFADIKEDTVTIDPRLIRSRITSKTKAIIPVDFAGHPADLKQVRKIADDNNLVIIEDAAHALGAKYYGKRIGSADYADMVTLSFHAVKHITTGEGGMVLTNNKDYYDRLKMLRSHGITREISFLNADQGAWYYEMRELGFNYRLTDFQSALGVSQLKKLQKFLKKREKIVAKYNRAFNKYDFLTPLAKDRNVESAHHLYVLRFDLKRMDISRREIFDLYRSQGILVNVHYIPVYYQPYYQKLGYRAGSCPIAEKYYEEAITLPLYPSMAESDVQRVIDVTRQIVVKHRKK